MLTIYVNLVSTPCRRVLYVANYLGLDYELKELEFRSEEIRSPDYRAIHPARKLPSITDDDFTLFESGAICKYLCRKVDSPLFPQDIREQAVMLQWEDFSLAHIGLALGKVMFNRLIAPKYGIPVNEGSITEGLKWLGRYLPIVEERLRESPYLAGEQITLADITLLSVLDVAEDSEVDLTQYPHLTRWRYGLQCQEFWRSVNDS